MGGFERWRYLFNFDNILVPRMRYVLSHQQVLLDVTCVSSLQGLPIIPSVSIQHHLLLFAYGNFSGPVDGVCL